jgi:hypothetical protein
MPTQAELFVTPKKRKSLRVKLRPGSIPMTYAAVTTNLIKKLTKAEEDEEPTAIEVKLPNFSQVKLPDGYPVRSYPRL